MKTKIHKKIWGHEKWIVNTSKYCGKILTLKKGYRCSIHYHKNKDETFYVSKGIVLLEVNGQKKILKCGDSQRVLPKVRHRFTGLKNSSIIEFSTHHEEEDSYRQKPSEKVPKEEFKKLLK